MDSELIKKLYIWRTNDIVEWWDSDDEYGKKQFMYTAIRHCDRNMDYDDWGGVSPGRWSGEVFYEAYKLLNEICETLQIDDYQEKQAETFLLCYYRHQKEGGCLQVLDENIIKTHIIPHIVRQAC